MPRSITVTTALTALILVFSLSCTRTSDSPPPPTLDVTNIDQHVDCSGLHPDEFHSRGCVVVSYLTVKNDGTTTARIGLCRLDDGRDLNLPPFGPGYWVYAPDYLRGADHDIQPKATLVVQAIDALGDEDAHGNALSDSQLRRQARQIHIHRAQCFNQRAESEPGFPGPWPEG